MLTLFKKVAATALVVGMMVVGGVHAMAADAIPQLTSDLQIGSRDPSVLILQGLLADDPTINFSDSYVTGYFGPITQAAVRGFQAKYGISSVGRVGPQTRGVINQFLAEYPFLLQSSNGVTCGVIPSTHLAFPYAIKYPTTSSSCYVLPSYSWTGAVGVVRY